MRKLLCISAILSATVLLYADWTEKIRRDHPRMYVNRQTLPEVREYAFRHYAPEIEALRKEVDALPDHPELKLRTDRFEIVNGKIKYNKPYSEGCQLAERIGADEAIKAATLYMLTGKPEYCAKSYAYLKMAVQFFEWCYNHHIMVDWHTESRINAVIAYDWLYNGLTPEERRAVIVPLLNNIRKLQPGGGADFHRNASNFQTGNYGVTNLPWFAGIAALNDGFDDPLAEKLLREGYERNIKMMDFRDKVSAGTGLLVAATDSYSFGAYPYATFHFLHIWESATGENIAPRWNQMRYYPHWFDWMQIPKDGTLLTYGIGDMQHTVNRLSTYLMYTHMAQAVHFYPQSADTARRLMTKLPAKDRKFHQWFPFLPFVLRRFEPDATPSGTAVQDHAGAAYFPSYGLAIMRSGAGQSDTHALFRTGSQYGQHQHYDESSFVIFKHDLLALDSGSRTSNMHHCYYAPQTVAHNTILIHQDGETAAPFWKPWGSLAQTDNKTIYSHGGQYRNTGAKNLAFVNTPPYVYAANDAIGVYRAEKCRQAVRQFVFIRPDYFIIFDRVTSVKPEQAKEYLLHVQNEPVEIAPGIYRADNGKGRLFQQTLWPLNPVIEKIGGPDREFYASGRNWPLPNGEKAFEKPNYFGQWRLQVRDRQESTNVCFLHLIEAADTGVAAMVPAKLLQDDKTLGVEFTDRTGKLWRVRFNRTGPVGVRINEENL